MGFIDLSGCEIVSPNTYDLVDDFSEGMSRVRRNGKFGFINTTGIEQIPCMYASALNFSEGLAAVKSERGWGFIDRCNNLVIDHQFEKTALGFREGLCAIVQYNRMGFIDKAGKIRIGYAYDPYLVMNECYLEFREGYCPVKVIGTCDHVYIDTNGDQIGDCYDLAYGFSSGLGLVVKNDKYGFIYSTGELIIPCRFDHAVMFSEDISVVSILN